MTSKTIQLIMIMAFMFFPSCNTKKYKGANDVIIAHAGGQIDEYTYTNSLEALNNSYKKGCRLLELDIVVSSDGKFVAAHQWKEFKEFTGHHELEDTPLSEAEFMSKSIFGKFTPMNMDMINKWFGEHEDAILVTDKINNPKLFCEHFLYKDRLIMELFSKKAIRDAFEEGIIPMVSEYMLTPDFDIEKEFEEMNIKYFAFSRVFMFENEELLKRLKANGVKSYVYSLTKEFDEKYILENKLDYVHGMYADNMDIMNYFKQQ